MKKENNYYDELSGKEIKSSKLFRKTDYPTSLEKRRENMFERILRLKGKKED